MSADFLNGIFLGAILGGVLAALITWLANALDRRTSDLHDRRMAVFQLHADELKEMQGRFAEVREAVTDAELTVEVTVERDDQGNRRPRPGSLNEKASDAVKQAERVTEDHRPPYMTLSKGLIAAFDDYFLAALARVSELRDAVDDGAWYDDTKTQSLHNEDFLLHNSLKWEVVHFLDGKNLNARRINWQFGWLRKQSTAFAKWAWRRLSEAVNG